MEAVCELKQFLRPETRFDLKLVALRHLSGLTHAEGGLNTIISSSDLLKDLVNLLSDGSSTVAKEVAVCLVNVSANEGGARELLKVVGTENVVNSLLKNVTEPHSPIADECCMVLSNLTRTPENVDKVMAVIEASSFEFDDLIAVFTKIDHNRKGAKLHYLGPVLANLSQNSKIRKRIVDREKCVLQRLLPFTTYEDSFVRRRGVVATLKNCCFETEHHEWLLSEDVDVLPRLLLPLAGNTEYDEEDNEKLPLELQYLPEDKEREKDPEIRRMLLEAVTQLCAKRVNREFIRAKNTYVILRELHEREEDPEAKAACENLVNILVRTEEEINAENLRELDIPEEIAHKFQTSARL